MPRNANTRTIVKTPLAPAAIGPYSQGVLAGETLYCSGQIPIDPEKGELITGAIEAEAERVLENLGAVLRAASMGYENVVRCTGLPHEHGRLRDGQRGLRPVLQRVPARARGGGGGGPPPRRPRRDLLRRRALGGSARVDVRALDALELDAELDRQP